MHLPHTFYFFTFLLPTRSSFVKYFALVSFFCNSLRSSLKADACMMLYAWCWLHRGEVSGAGEGQQHKEHSLKRLTHTLHIRAHTTRLSPLLPLSLLSPSASVAGPTFPSSSLRIISYCCLYRLLICCWCCFSDETFFFWCWSCFLCSETAALHSAFCCRGWV